MYEAESNGTHECRHCSGLCAGRAAKCPYCKKWLRREPAGFLDNSIQAVAHDHDGVDGGYQRVS